MIGWGTSDVESLPSYILRSAYWHGVSGSMFIRHVFKYSENKLKRKTSWQLGNDRIETLARVNMLSSFARESLKELTGHEMNCEPLDFLERQIRGISCEIGGFRWCPECFAEMEQIDAPFYFKQIWHMRAVVHCPVHRVRLLDQCDLCGSTQNSFGAQQSVGFCVDCGQALSKRKKTLAPEDMVASWECAAHDILEIFERAARPGMIGKGMCNLGDFVQAVEDFLKRADKEPGVDVEVRKFVEKYARNWRTHCRLICLRRLAYLMNLSLFEVLACSHYVNPMLLTTVGLDHLPEHLEMRKKTFRHHEKIFKIITEYVERQNAPPSLKEIAEYSQVSTGYLNHRFHNLARSIVENHRRHEEQLHLMNRKDAQAAAVRFFTAHPEVGHQKSRKEAYRVLREETGLPKWVLKNAIQSVYSALHFDH